MRRIFQKPHRGRRRGKAMSSAELEPERTRNRAYEPAEMDDCVPGTRLVGHGRWQGGSGKIEDRPGLCDGLSCDQRGSQGGGSERRRGRRKRRSRLRKEERLRFKHYRLLGQDTQALLRSYESWAQPLKPSDEVLVRFEAKGLADQKIGGSGSRIVARAEENRQNGRTS